MAQRGGSFRHRRVSTELRELRLKRGLSCRDVSEAIGVSESKISRMETGERGLYADDVAAILGFLRAPLQLRQELVALVRDGQSRNWHAIQRGNLPGNWSTLIRFESEATALRTYEPLLIPALAQTPEYCRLILSGLLDDVSEQELEALVATRMSRQVVIGRTSVHLMVDETVLRRHFGDPGMLRDQLTHLRALGQRRRVTLQVVPFSAPAHPGLDGSFLILEFSDQSSLLYEEGRHTSSFLEEETHIESARFAWSAIKAVAMTPEESIGFIASIEAELA